MTRAVLTLVTLAALTARADYTFREVKEKFDRECSGGIELIQDKCGVVLACKYDFEAATNITVSEYYLKKYPPRENAVALVLSQSWFVSQISNAFHDLKVTCKDEKMKPFVQGIKVVKLNVLEKTPEPGKRYQFNKKSGELSVNLSIDEENKPYRRVKAFSEDELKDLISR